jgi:5-hydroxyisourate hydrolase-like protein (transthyretin family)
MRTFERPARWPIPALGFILVCSCAALSAQNAIERREPTAARGVFRIAGVVVSETTGAPLESARVTIFDTANRRNTQGTITASDGRFEFNHLTAGKYSLQGERRGFVLMAYEQHGQFSTAVVTGAALETENLILRLVPAATISGQIFDEAGEPVRHAQVRLYRANRDLGFSRIDPSGGADSDDRGYYDFWPLFPGTYYVSAEAQPWYAMHPSHSQDAAASFQAVDPSLDVSYPTTFYGDTTEPDGTTPISLKGGDRVQIDIHLNPVRSLRLLVHASDDGQFPTLQKRVFDSVEEAGSERVERVSADTYEMTGVPAGRYTVRLHGSSGDEDRITEMNLTQDGQELDSSSGEPLGSLTLSVKIAGEEKLPEQLYVTLRDARERTEGFQAVDKNGAVHFEGLPAGKYVIIAVSPGKDYLVSQISSPGSGAPGTSGSSFDLTPGASLSLSAQLAPSTTKVEGFVRRSGKPAAGVMVVLVPADAESNIDVFRRDQSDFDGSFTLRNVLPGSYTLIAIEDGWNVDWSVPTVLARYTPRGQKLTVGPQTQGSVSLPKPVEAQPR